MRPTPAILFPFALILPATISAASYPSDYAESTVKISISMGHGSGVYLGNNLILTAQHVVDGASVATIKTDTGKTAEAKVLWSSKEYDIALLELKTPLPLKSSKLACRDIRLGEALEAHGNPLSNEFVVTWGRVAKTPHTIQEWKSVVLADLTVAGGMSGGPVFDWWGKIVGVVVGSYDYPPLSVLVPSSVVCTLMAGQVRK